MEKVVNVEKEEKAMTNNLIKDYVMSKLGKLQGLPIMLNYTGDMNCFYVMKDTQIYFTTCKDGITHYANICGMNESEDEEVGVSIDIDKMKCIQGEALEDDFGQVDIIMENSLISIDYN